MSAGSTLDAALTRGLRASGLLAYMVTKKKIERSRLEEAVAEMEESLRLTKSVLAASETGR